MVDLAVSTARVQALSARAAHAAGTIATAGAALGGVDGGGAPPATGRALEALRPQWREGVRALADAVHGLSGAATTAAVSYATFESGAAAAFNRGAGGGG